jgi:hypothetical protein
VQVGAEEGSIRGWDVHEAEITWVTMVCTDNEDSVALVRFRPGRKRRCCGPPCHDVWRWVIPPWVGDVNA